MERVHLDSNAQSHDLEHPWEFIFPAPLKPIDARRDYFNGRLQDHITRRVATHWLCGAANAKA